MSKQIKNELKEVLKETIEMGKNPSEYFRNMSDEELKEKYPEVAILKGNMQRPDFHPEGDVFEHTMQVMDSAAILLNEKFTHLSYEEKEMILVGTLTHDFGKEPAKAIDEKTGFPSHQKHEALGVPIAEGFIDRLEAPEWKKGVKFITLNHGKMHTANKMNVQTLIKFAKEIEEEIGLEAFIVATSADTNGRVSLDKDFEETVNRDVHPHTDLLKKALIVESKYELDTSIELPKAELEAIQSNTKIPEDKKQSAIESRLKKRQELDRSQKIDKEINEEKEKIAENEGLAF